MKTVMIKDYYGKYHNVPVSDELYEEWRILQNETQRVYRAEVRHRSAVPLDDVDAYLYHPYSSEIEDSLIQQERDRELFDAISKLTPKQRYRVQMMLDDVNLWEMQEYEKCSYNGLKHSACAALKKIRKYMTD